MTRRPTFSRYRCFCDPTPTAQLAGSLHLHSPTFSSPQREGGWRFSSRNSLSGKMRSHSPQLMQSTLQKTDRYWTVSRQRSSRRCGRGEFIPSFQRQRQSEHLCTPFTALVCVVAYKEDAHVSLVHLLPAERQSSATELASVEYVVHPTHGCFATSHGRLPYYELEGNAAECASDQLPRCVWHATARPLYARRVTACSRCARYASACHWYARHATERRRRRCSRLGQPSCHCGPRPSRATGHPSCKTSRARARHRVVARPSVRPGQHARARRGTRTAGPSGKPRARRY